MSKASEPSKASEASEPSEPLWKTKYTTCKCGNCTSSPGHDPNESCCFCNGSCTIEDFYKDDEELCNQAKNELAELAKQAKRKEEQKEREEREEQKEREYQDRVNEEYQDRMNKDRVKKNDKRTVSTEYIGAINHENDYMYFAAITGDMAMAVLLEDVPYEGVITEKEARETVRKFVEEEGWERLTEEQVKAYDMF